MPKTELTEALEDAEGLIVQGQSGAARELLSRLAEDAEEYVDRNCPTTDELQWFSFPSLFERLAYRRVEQDPRELRDVGEPFDRLYDDLGLACVQDGDYDAATSALRQAVRWNPMGCEHRLNLADLYLNAGDVREYLALSNSVFARASDPAHLERAFLNFANYFEAQGQHQSAAAALWAAKAAGADTPKLAAALDQASGTERDPSQLTREQAEEILGKEGLPIGANAEIAICMLMCATDAADRGDRDEATRLIVRTRDLVGAENAKALLALVKGDEDAEQEQEQD